MIHSVGSANTAALQPDQDAGRQLGGREVVQMRPGAQNVLLRALDQAHVNQNALQGRLERQVQQREVALFDAAHENVNLNGRLNEVVRQTEEQRNRINDLDEQLVAAVQLRDTLRGQLAEIRIEGHLLRAQVENNQRIRNDIQRRLDASEVRIGNLEQQIANERVAQIRLNHLNELRVQKAQIEIRISNAVQPQATVLISGAIAGLAFGGPIGALVGFFGSMLGCSVSPCNEAERVNIRALHRVKTEMAEIDPNAI